LFCPGHHTRHSQPFLWIRERCYSFVLSWTPFEIFTAFLMDFIRRTVRNNRRQSIRNANRIALGRASRCSRTAWRRGARWARSAAWTHHSRSRRPRSRPRSALRLRASCTPAACCSPLLTMPCIWCNRLVRKLTSNHRISNKYRSVTALKQ
jgi:hypothetical protein